jgi:spermidine dehydrogenase
MEDVVMAKFDYAKLDDDTSPVRVRLNSTVIHAANIDGPGNPQGVEVTYVRGGKARIVQGRACLLACWNMVIPYMCPEMPEAQKDGLAYNVKVPLVYTNVQLKNWQAFQKLQVHSIHCPGSFFSGVEMDFPVSIGDYRFTQQPDESCLVHLQYVPVGTGVTARDKQRGGRGRLMRTNYATFERNVREQLARMLGSGGFDPASDVEAITVNRWPHGYAPEYNPLFDPDVPEVERAHVVGRTRFGRIAIANSDSGGGAYTDSAIDQGHRAAMELLHG